MEQLDVADLTDDQISQLLEEAESRLSSKASAKKNTALAQATQPVLEAGGNVIVTNDAAPKSATADVSLRNPLAERRTKEKQDDTAGPAWFNLPKTNLTPELKRDLHLIRLRGVLDTKRHWKKDTRRDFVPKYSQVGTIVEGPTDFYSGRLTRKERKRTIVEEVLASKEASSSKFKSRYDEIQTKKTSGKKAFYKKLVAGRRRGK